jgi:diguanylate cyclase (GGDEF)-like protein
MTAWLLAYGIPLFLLLLLLVTAMGWYLAERQIARCKAEAEKVCREREANDPVTGHFAMHHFVRVAHIQMRLAHRHKWPMSLLVVDLVGLEKINLQHGLKAGDAALREVGEILRNHLRGSDVVGRDGGRFMILLPECPDSDLPAVWERLVLALGDRTVRWGGEEIPLRWHGAGVTMFGIQVQFAQMQRLALKALERAKQERRLVVVDKNGLELRP